MSNITKQNSSTPVTEQSEPIMGRVVQGDLVRPGKQQERRDLATATIGKIRHAVDAVSKISGGVLRDLVLLLILTPDSSTDSDGKVTDCLTPLTRGDGKIMFVTPEGEADPKAKAVFDSKVSQARAAAPLLAAAKVTSSGTPEYKAALQITGRAGVGAEKVAKAIEGKSAAKVAGMLRDVHAATGDDKAALIKQTFNPGVLPEGKVAKAERVLRDALHSAGVALTKYREICEAEKAKDKTSLPADHADLITLLITPAEVTKK